LVALTHDICHPIKYNEPKLLKEKISSLDLGYFLSAIPNILPNVYISSSQIFPYYDSALLKNYPGFEKPYHLTDAFVKDILYPNLNILNEINHSRRFYYFSGSLNMPQFEQIYQYLGEDISYFSKMYLHDDTDRQQNVEANLWLGGKSVVASAHYDAVVNVFIQLFGEKRIILSPPKDIIKMGVYGRYHPRACQIRRANLSTGEYFKNLKDSNDCPITHSESTVCDRNNYEKIEFLLRAGDVLYIPPFWVHEVMYFITFCTIDKCLCVKSCIYHTQVESISASISLSLWQDAPELSIMDGDLFSYSFFKSKKTKLNQHHLKNTYM
jgi:hypothetical protein